MSRGDSDFKADDERMERMETKLSSAEQLLEHRQRWRAIYNVPEPPEVAFVAWAREQNCASCQFWLREYSDCQIDHACGRVMWIWEQWQAWRALRETT